MTIDTTIEKRFWGRVIRGDGCWMWTGAKVYTGHGVVSFEGRQWRTSRLAYHLLVGPIPNGLCVCHRCDVPACCNPAHLFLGTNAENTADRHAKGRDARGARHGSVTKPERRSRGDRHWTRVRPGDVLRGANHGCAKLNQEAVDTMREMSSRGVKQRDIAAT